MKYVALRETCGGGLLTVVLGFNLTHAQLADAFASTHTPVSAGFCEPMSNGGWRTWGRSESLSLSPAHGDGLLLAAFARATRRTS